MRFWSGECSRAFTDWRDSYLRVQDVVWTVGDVVIAHSIVKGTTL
jgi:hypothetical protein